MRHPHGTLFRMILVNENGRKVPISFPLLTFFVFFSKLAVFFFIATEPIRYSEKKIYDNEYERPVITSRQDEREKERERVRERERGREREREGERD